MRSARSHSCIMDSLGLVNDWICTPSMAKNAVTMRSCRRSGSRYSSGSSQSTLVMVDQNRIVSVLVELVGWVFWIGRFDGEAHEQCDKFGTFGVEAHGFVQCAGQMSAFFGC